MRKFPALFLLAVALAGGCKDVTTKEAVVHVTPMEWAAMTPEAKATGNFVVDDGKPLRPYSNSDPNMQVDAPTVSIEPKPKPPATRELSYDELNRAREPSP